MTKKLLFCILFFGSFIVYGQTDDYGVLIRTIMNPKNPNSITTRYTIEARKDDLNRFSTRNILPTSQTFTQYDFFLSRDVNLLYFLALEQKSYEQVNCVKEYTIPYNKTTFNQENFGGCVGNSTLWTIHLTQPNMNNICDDEIVNLTNGWNWEYQFDSDGWKPFPAQFQEKRSVTFKLKDLNGYNGKSQIFFRTGFKTQFTNIVTYNVTTCSPELVNKKPVTSNVKCSNESSGSATLQFKTALNDNQKFLFNLLWYNTDLKQFVFLNSESVLKKDIQDNTYTWNNIAHGTYIIKYQAQTSTENNDKVGSSAISTDSFTIEDVKPLTFNLTDIQPKCSTDNGAVLIAVKGGTPPYYYILDNETKKLLSKNPDTITLSTNGEHKIIVVDDNNCKEN